MGWLCTALPGVLSRLVAGSWLHVVEWSGGVTAEEQLRQESLPMTSKKGLWALLGCTVHDAHTSRKPESQCSMRPPPSSGANTC